MGTQSAKMLQAFYQDSTLPYLLKILFCLKRNGKDSSTPINVFLKSLHLTSRMDYLGLDDKFYCLISLKMRWCTSFCWSLITFIASISTNRLLFTNSQIKSKMKCWYNSLNITKLTLRKFIKGA